MCADDVFSERLLIYQQSLDISFAVAPYLAKQDEVAAVEKAELKGVDFTFKSADAKFRGSRYIGYRFADCELRSFRKGDLFPTFTSARSVVEIIGFESVLGAVTLDCLAFLL